ncbi:helix-turn-helix transcriptional regulator [Burkholderia sp. BCC0097]|uniref:helix-turn-helix domain-containing protein n=1 Tax=Burkholderia sp. BCC0097 TaxID=2676289 RepID=UPI001FC867B7|nr:helix-turn-helix transcriptional regulator [Burkholderia sp. BCC0097]
MRTSPSIPIAQSRALARGLRGLFLAHHLQHLLRERLFTYAEYMAQRDEERDLIPHAVVSATVDGATPLRAWREYLGLTQAEVATRLGISQSAYAQQESSEKLRKSTREKIAAALGITDAQLDV